MSRDPDLEVTRLRQFHVNLIPDFLIGHFLGLVIGDGWVNKTKSRNYVIAMETTREDYANLFSRIIRKRFPSLRIFSYRRTKTRRFPDGRLTSSPSIMTWVNCKQLFLVLRPCKLQDFHWIVPEMILQSKEAIRGFLRGIFDAEGCVDVSTRCIALISKHRENLQQIHQLLLEFGIPSHLQKSRNELRVTSRGNCILFQKEIGFGYFPKRRKLAKICKVKYGPNIVSQARELRTGGLTYVEIAKKLGVKSDNSIREWLQGKKTPWAVRNKWALD